MENDITIYLLAEENTEKSWLCGNIVLIKITWIKFHFKCFVVASQNSHLNKFS